MKEFLTSGKARIKCQDWVWCIKNTKPQTPKPQNTKHSTQHTEFDNVSSQGRPVLEWSARFLIRRSLRSALRATGGSITQQSPLGPSSMHTEFDTLRKKFEKFKKNWLNKLLFYNKFFWKKKSRVVKKKFYYLLKNFHHFSTTFFKIFFFTDFEALPLPYPGFFCPGKGLLLRTRIRTPPKNFNIP